MAIHALEQYLSILHQRSAIGDDGTIFHNDIIVAAGLDLSSQCDAGADKMLPLPIPDVTVNTRKGVFVNYIPAEIAG